MGGCSFSGKTSTKSDSVIRSTNNQINIHPRHHNINNLNQHTVHRNTPNYNNQNNQLLCNNVSIKIFI